MREPSHGMAGKSHSCQREQPPVGRPRRVQGEVGARDHRPGARSRRGCATITLQASSVSSTNATRVPSARHRRRRGRPRTPATTRRPGPRPSRRTRRRPPVAHDDEAIGVDPRVDPAPGAGGRPGRARPAVDHEDHPPRCGPDPGQRAPSGDHGARRRSDAGHRLGGPQHRRHAAGYRQAICEGRLRRPVLRGLQVGCPGFMPGAPALAAPTARPLTPTRRAAAHRLAGLPRQPALRRPGRLHAVPRPRGRRARPRRHGVRRASPYPELDDPSQLVKVPSLDLYRSSHPFRVPWPHEFRDTIDLREFAPHVRGRLPRAVHVQPAGPARSSRTAATTSTSSTTTSASAAASSR